MLKKIFVLFTFVLLLTTSVCLASPSNDRWEWLSSNDTCSFYFDKNTVKFGTKEQINNATYTFHKTLDKSKIVVFIKTVYTDASREHMAGQAEAAGLYELAEITLNTEYVIRKYEFDYTNRLLRSTGGAWYDSSGNLLIQQNDFAHWGDILPNSNAEHWAEVIHSYTMKNYDEISSRTI